MLTPLWLNVQAVSVPAWQEDLKSYVASQPGAEGREQRAALADALLSASPTAPDSATKWCCPSYTARQFGMQLTHTCNPLLQTWTHHSRFLTCACIECLSTQPWRPTQVLQQQRHSRSSGMLQVGIPVS